MSQIRTVVVPAAGFGTRLLPATKAVPKELLPLLDRPALEWIAAEAAAAGITRMIIVASPHKGSLAGHFSEAPALEALLAGRDESLLETVRRSSRMLSVETVIQEQALGLGHAVLCAREAVGEERFAVILPDDVFVGEQPAIAALLETGSNAVGYLVVAPEEVARYGIIEAGEESANGIYRLRSIVEKPDPALAPSLMAAMGRYVFGPEIFEALVGLPRGAGGEIQLTDGIARLAASGEVRAVPIPGRRLDIGTTAGWLEANLRLGLADPRYAPRLRAVIRELEG